ncbi:MAG: CusA/CzcA family heavy metal efflux RND transporter [Raineya sp.]|nr:CusA/CzcA family heavy metal efflux RND transporter [Raineya sp.]
MLDAVIGFSIRNKIIVAIAILFLIISGIYALTQIPIDAVPDITNNQVQVITPAPQFSAQEVEQFITAPLEIAFANLQNVEEIRSISRFGLSVITIVFADEMDIYLARQLVNEKIKLAEKDIPLTMGQPYLAPVSTGLGEIYQYVIRPLKGYEKRYNAQDLRTIQDWIIRRRLAGIEGVVEVNSFGGKVKQYEVALEVEKLRAYDLTISEVFEAMHRNNENTGGSYIEHQGKAYFIRAEGLVKTLQDIEQTPIKTMPNGMPVLVRDVGKVRLGSAIRYGAMTQDGKGEVVGGIVMMLKGANSAQVIERVKQRIAEIQKTLPEGLVIEPFLDRTLLVNKAIFTVSENLALGGLIVVFVLILFLGNLRAGLIVASVIPLSLLFTLTMMNLLGVSANLMSLGAIDFGLIVDGAVIIVEAILHYLHNKALLNSEYSQISQKTMDEQVFVASKRIRQSAAFGEIIILMVYLPIWSLSGIEGKMFKPMAQAVSFAILGAFLLSLTYVPMMSAWGLSKKIHTQPNFSDKMMAQINRFYKPLMLWALRRKMQILGATLGLFVIALLIFTNLGGEFIPQLDEGDFAIEVRLKTGVSLSETIRISTEMEKVLLQFPEVKTCVSKIGSSEIPTDPMPIEANDLMVILKDKSEWKTASSKAELAEKMEKALQEHFVGVNFEFQQPIQMRFNELMTGVKSDIAIKIYGDNLALLAQKAEQAAQKIRKIDGVADIKIEQVLGLPQIMIHYNRNKMAQYSLDVQTLNRAVRTAFAGEVAGVVFEGEKRFEVVIRLDTTQRNHLENLKNLYVRTAQGNQVRLEEVAQISYQPAPVQISRENTKRRIVIGINVRGRDVESVVKDIQGIFEKKQIRLPAGYFVEFGGQFENLEKGKQRLMIAVPIALGMIFMLLYFTFHSFKQAILIFTAIPLSAIGGIVALWVRGMPFSISAGVGFIALFGVAVLNGIVLIAYFNQLAKEGIKNLHRRILQGVLVRLRPVLMTASVASLGFAPMALSTSAGAEVQKPLATVVIGGLISATFLTLVVLPILYYFSEKSFKPSKATTIAILLILLGMSLVQVQAQTITLEEALQIAKNQNLLLQSKKTEILYQSQLQKTAFQLPKMALEGQYGQINVIENTDFSLQISQSFASPKLYRVQSEFWQSRINLAQQDYALQEKILTNEIKSIFYQHFFVCKRIEIWQAKIRLYEKLLKVATRKWQEGETHILEKTSAETFLQEAKQNQEFLEKEKEILQNQLALRLGRAERFFLDTNLIRKLPLPDTLALSQENVFLKLWQEQKNIATQERKIAEVQRLPDFRVGYYTMSVEGKPLAQVFQVGIALPIVSKFYQKSIQAAKTKEYLSQMQYEYQKQVQNQQRKILWSKLQQNLTWLTFHEQTALKQASIILEKAEAMMRVGEIDYTTFVQTTEQAWKIRLNYLEALENYNLTLLQWELLQ